ncbi:glycoside hydrolase family 127 protein [Oleiharenicola sp. Vm1]|uniref:glycoside hydrolase family 127 protein n=1 Tax=Oleiharenicola sp. Vm1 TaxID=3398393 RepID=UPI0039F4EB63
MPPVNPSARSDSPDPVRVTLAGVLGDALQRSRENHLATFIESEASPAIALFRAEHVCGNQEGDWYGEHAGKWLVAAARAARHAPASPLAASVRRVADFLVQRQDVDGYLGTYAPNRRFMCRQGPAPLTWDGAPAQRTWDIWVHSYLILGLLEAARAFGEPRYLEAARRIGDLCWRTFHTDKIPVTSLGNHHGLSATILIDPAMELYFASQEPRYLALARLILAEIEAAPALNLIAQILADTDAANLATGKAYQLCWNLVGIAKLGRATNDERLARAVRIAWQNIRDHHLTLGGGPWGGVAHRSREVFNPRPVFSPQGYVETCSTLAWIQLNRELLRQTGEAQFAEEIEKSAYNDLLGAQAPNGDNWCYYSFPNGRRVFTTYWRCCKSSGPMALEELPLSAYSVSADGSIAVNLYGASDAALAHPAAGSVRVRQETEYPFAGSVRIHVSPERPAPFALRLRVPVWAERFSVAVNGTPHVTPPPAAGFLTLERVWTPGDIVAVEMEMPPRVHRRTNRNIQESRAPDGSPIAQEVLHFDYAAVTRGPLVYASALIDGFKTEETLRLPDPPRIETLPPPDGSSAPALRLELGYRAPLILQPYFEAGGRRDRTWRLTWFSLAPD